MSWPRGFERVWGRETTLLLESDTGANNLRHRSPPSLTQKNTPVKTPSLIRFAREAFSGGWRMMVDFDGATPRTYAATLHQDGTFATEEVRAT